MICYTYNAQSVEVRAVECSEHNVGPEMHYGTWAQAHEMLIAQLIALVANDKRVLRDIEKARTRYAEALDEDAQRLVKAETLRPSWVQHDSK